MRMAKRAWRGCEIDILVDEKLRFAAIEGDENARFHPRRFRPCGRQFLCEEMRELQDHIRPRGHFPGLTATEECAGINLRGAVAVIVDDVKSCARVAVVQFHAPTESMAFVSPVCATRIKEMPQGNEQLNRCVEAEKGEHQRRICGR